jgi:hypothetical protein
MPENRVAGWSPAEWLLMSGSNKKAQPSLRAVRGAQVVSRAPNLADTYAEARHLPSPASNSEPRCRLATPKSWAARPRASRAKDRQRLYKCLVSFLIRELVSSG